MLRRRENGPAPVFSLEPGIRLITKVSTSALVIVRPTAMTTGPMPELPRLEPSTLAISSESTASRYLCGWWCAPDGARRRVRVATYRR